MPNPIALVSLARVMALLKDPAASLDDQRSAFRAFLARHEDAPLQLVVQGKAIEYNGLLVDMDLDPAIRHMGHQLLECGIGEVAVPPALEPSSMLAVLRTLVAPTTQFPRLQQRLDHLQAEGITGVEISPPLPEATDQAEAGERVLEKLGRGAASEQSPGMLHFMSAGHQTQEMLDGVIKALTEATREEQISPLLDAVVSFGDVAAQKEAWDDVLNAGAAIVTREEATDNPALKRLYSIALRRLVSRTTLEHLGQLTASGPHKRRAVAILSHLGAEPMEVLIRLLVGATDVGERRSYFSAIMHLRGGDGLLINMLNHDEWFVVRNVADLCGEMQIADAVPALALASEHDDERVRRSAAGALAKIGTPGAMGPLRRALSDASAPVRLQIALALSGTAFRNLVPAIVARLDQEEVSDIRHELLLALGRIGTRDAIRVLAERAQPDRRMFRKRPTSLRIAAIHGLQLVGGEAAIDAVEQVAEDRDDEVRRVAGEALRDLKGSRE